MRRIIERAAPSPPRAGTSAARQSPRASPPTRPSPRLLAVRRRAAPEERGADARERRGRPAGQGRGRGVRRLRRRHLARCAAAADAAGHGDHSHHADHGHHGDHAHHAQPTRERRPQAPAHAGVAGRPRRRSLRAVGAGVWRRRRTLPVPPRPPWRRRRRMPATRPRRASPTPPRAGRRSSGTARPLPPDLAVVVALSVPAGTHRRARTSVEGARSRSPRLGGSHVNLVARARPAPARALAFLRAPARRRAGARAPPTRRWRSPPCSSASTSPRRGRRRCRSRSRRRSKASPARRSRRPSTRPTPRTRSSTCRA